MRVLAVLPPILEPIIVRTAAGLVPTVVNKAEDIALELRNAVIFNVFKGKIDGRATNSGNKDSGSSPAYIVYIITITLVSS